MLAQLVDEGFKIYRYFHNMLCRSAEKKESIKIFFAEHWK